MEFLVDLSVLWQPLEFKFCQMKGDPDKGTGSGNESVVDGCVFFVKFELLLYVC